MKKTATRILISLVVAAVLVSCNGQGTSPIVNDYRTGIKDPRVHPESLCVGNGRGGWICSGGGSSTPHTPYGTQGSCGAGYLYFSDGCEDIGTNIALYPNWGSWSVFGSYAFLKFNDSHFWPTHLACYLTGSTNAQVDQAITNNFNIYHCEQAGDPVVGTSASICWG